jgi:hypothetical protein
MRRVLCSIAVLLLCGSMFGTTFVPAAGSHACCKHKHAASEQCPTVDSTRHDGSCCDVRIVPTAAVRTVPASHTFAVEHPIIEEFFPSASPAPAKKTQTPRAPPLHLSER